MNWSMDYVSFIVVLKIKITYQYEIIGVVVRNLLGTSDSLPCDLLISKHAFDIDYDSLELIHTNISKRNHHCLFGTSYIYQS